MRVVVVLMIGCVDDRACLAQAGPGHHRDRANCLQLKKDRLLKRRAGIAWSGLIPHAQRDFLWRRASSSPLVAGNWKMNGFAASRTEFAEILCRCGGAERQSGTDGVSAGDLDQGFCCRGARLGCDNQQQDCHAEPSGAHTGDVSGRNAGGRGGRRRHRGALRAANGPS